jgi:hypothetical protein
MATATQADVDNESRAAGRSRLRLLVPFILLLVYAAQCVWFMRTQSLTFDEPLHVYAGLDAWRNHRFQFWNDHPPLARLLLTIPLIDSKWQVDAFEHPDGADEVRSIQPDAIALATRARAVNVVLGVILGVLLWLAARRWWSESAANFALGLFAFSPALIAHFSVISTDGIGTLVVFATALQLARWRRRPTRLNAISLGLMLGLLLLAKFYTPPFLLLTLALVLVLKPAGCGWHPRQWNWSAAAAAVAIAIVIFWAGYFFHTSHVTARADTLVATYPNRPPLVKHMATPIPLNLWVPAGEYIDGLRAVKLHNHLGHPSYFLGRVSQGGWRSYYPVLVLLKWPVLITALFLTTGVLVIMRKLHAHADFLVLAIYPAMMLALAITARIQIGERHILPAYPFVLLFCAGLWEYARRRLNVIPTSGRRETGKRKRALQIALLAALLLNAVDVLRYAPDYLAYFNVFVRPSQSWNLLSDSNLDWGQGLIALRSYEQQHPDERIHLAYFGSVHPEIYGVHALPLPPSTCASGTVIVSATELSGQYLHSPDSYRWVLQYPVKAVLAHSLLVFDVR